MKGLMRVFWLVLVAIGPVVSAYSAEPARVLLIARETSADMGMMIEKEVGPIMQSLKEAGYVVTVASESGTTIVGQKSQLAVDKKLADVDVREYVGVIVPCMAAGGSSKEIPPGAVQLVAEASRVGLPLAAQQSGVRILALAGVLKGRNYATAAENRDVETGGNYKGIGVVRDGPIVTSGTCPYMAAANGTRDGTEELATTFISVLGKH